MFFNERGVNQTLFSILSFSIESLAENIELATKDSSELLFN